MAKKNFEESLARLEEITGELEKGDLSLESSLKKFEEGVKLVEFCNHKLDEAQSRIDLLLKKDAGYEAVPFAEEEDDDSTE